MRRDENPRWTSSASETRSSATATWCFVFTAVMRLPERYRVPLVLHYYGGFSTEEIAKLLHVPGPTVRTRLARGRGRLRAMLEGDCYD